ncbi:OmpA family protein [Flavobacterium urocaniciphilum]|uniref:WD40-like Beta Propeller Repeat n=1 Tax=Flavobacterium urocaniciphilum TaxID=1299341 RepID=A0A1H8Z4M4_9FLAO|nr:OmpA family protein [Flavobacterium urocaniciphilum]SEP59404.1 WD40-like Beta Propeller Repeat [Flavobacterium urocaniciphilum]
MKKIIVLLLFVSCFSQAQQAKLNKADKEFNSFAYVDAIEVYEKVLQNGYKSPELYEKLGNSYYLNGESEKAANCYKSLIEYNTEIDPEIYFKYSHCLKALGKYDEANKMMSIYYDKTSNTGSKKELDSYLTEIRNNSRDYIIKPTDINSEFSDYGPSYYANKVYFTSAIDTAAVKKKIHEWTGQNFTDIYVANVNKDTTLSYSGNFSKKVNTKFNESSPIFTKDGKTMYFTRNNFLNGKKGKSEDKSTFVKIYKATLVEGEWGNITELPFNNNQSSFAHPALSLDEKTMYFASDMAGTNGYSDIYKVKINADGSFGSPENLGKHINTTGRESFPSVDKEGNLYFASDGHLGLGGLDLFIAKINSDGSFQNPVNLGEKINSPKDDFAATFYDKISGFFTSNRDNGKGFDDIYYFRENICKQKAEGIVYDAQTNLPIAGATVILFDDDMKEVEKISSDDKGFYTFNVDCSKKYYIRGLKEEYEPAEVKLITNAVHEKVNKNDLFLSKKQIPIDEGTDLAKLFNISKIYFDLDKSNIRPDAEVHLQKIIEVLKQYPNMTIDIRSHTDSRQTHKYNEALSDRRAKSTLEYIVKNKIARNRLTAKGYGETQLVNKCADNVPCTEEEHQMNRRSEFIIVKMK